MKSFDKVKEIPEEKGSNSEVDDDEDVLDCIIDEENVPSATQQNKSKNHGS